MILLYTFVLLLLGALHLLVSRRAKSLEKKFSRLSLAASKLANTPRPGNSRHDACAAAKQQYELGRLILRRDRLEGKYYRWQHLGDRLARLVNGLRQWKGKKLPYTMGVIDVSTLLYLADRFGLAFIDLSQLTAQFSALLTR